MDTCTSDNPVKKTRYGWTPEEALLHYQNVSSYTFEKPTDARRTCGRWYVKAKCRLCGRDEWVAAIGYHNRVGCNPKCKEYEKYPPTPQQRRKRRTNWDLGKFWPREVTWDRSKEAYWRQPT